MNLRYRFDSSPGGAHEVLLAQIEPRTRVLDVGCARGYLGSRLAQKGCEVWGIERDPEACAAIPIGAYVDVLQADLQLLDNLPWPEPHFDVILAADVLEHLVNPVDLMQLLRRYVKGDGRLLVSLPNVAHLSVRLALLRGRFQYTQTGILDRTHMHLYTYSTALDLLRQGGFAPQRLLVGSDRFGVLLNRVRPFGRIMRGLLAYNILVEARPV